MIRVSRSGRSNQRRSQKEWCLGFKSAVVSYVMRGILCATLDGGGDGFLWWMLLGGKRYERSEFAT